VVIKANLLPYFIRPAPPAGKRGAAPDILFVVAGFSGRYMEDRPPDIPEDDGAMLDTRRYAGGETPINDVFFVIDGNFDFRAEVLDIIVVKAEKAEHFIKVVGMRLTKLDFFPGAGQYPLGLGVKLGAGDSIGIDLDNRLNGLGVVLHAVRRIFGVGFRSIDNIFSVFTLMHFSYLFPKIK
jgi:hypothetical protein